MGLLRKKRLELELTVDLYAGGVDGIAAHYHLSRSYRPFFPADLLRDVRFRQGCPYPTIYLDGDCVVRERSTTVGFYYPRYRGRSQMGRLLYPRGFRLIVPKTMLKRYRLS